VGADLIGGRVQADARDHGVDHHIRFLGLHDDVRPLLAAADVFVLPSTHEGLPTSIMEAMAMQLPVVASCVGGIPELVVPNETGLFIQPGDVRGLEDAVVQLLLAPLLRDRFGTNARRRVLEHFSLDRMVAALKSEYTSLAQPQ
jgi:glycosyltransferase involved in cell wall biosynthesis